MNTRKYFYIANWKMNWDYDETVSFVSRHSDDCIALSKDKKLCQFVVCPSYIALAQTASIFQESEVKVGAQDCSDHHKGSFTGQISAEQIKTAGGSFCIIGHSEQRKHAYQSNEAVAHKCEQALLADLTPILCVGETGVQFGQGKTLGILEEQLKPVVDLLAPKHYLLHDKEIIIAYEPVWAIGTNVVPTMDHLESVYGWLSNFVSKHVSSAHVFLVYGGSVSAQTVKDLKKISLISGFLIGGASLDFQEFKKIVECT